MIVTETQREKGYGKALLATLARDVGGVQGGAKGVNQYGMGRLQWSVLEWNEPAIRLFLGGSVGAFVKEGYLGC